MRELLPSLSVTPRPDWTFDPDSARAALMHHFGVTTLAGFGFDDHQPCLSAAGALLLYLQETLKAEPRPSHAGCGRYAGDRFLFLDEVTRRSLELTRTLRDGGRAGSLLAVHRPHGRRRWAPGCCRSGSSPRWPTAPPSTPASTPWPS